LTFAAEDSRMGIPKKYTALFEKFYRGTHREALTQRGTGLGLAIVNPSLSAIAGRFGWRVN